MMKRDVDILCEAINLAHYDKLESVEVSIRDLMVLRNEILVNNPIVEGMKKELKIIKANLTLKSLEKPTKLDTYC